ncbi:hypothetical protein Taro_012294 [Colocasia esculenta]|uniref:Uncharacterized protein n=1 Tax=Colocasia esculenta TaxID=4460 RepID=A0A843U8M5_COLES|nr:hypothetical protein [Colocasia esculenta]
MDPRGAGPASGFVSLSRSLRSSAFSFFNPPSLEISYFLFVIQSCDLLNSVGRVEVLEQCRRALELLKDSDVEEGGGSSAYPEEIRIRTCPMGYSSLNYSVSWNQGLSIGTWLQRVKVVLVDEAKRSLFSG